MGLQLHGNIEHRGHGTGTELLTGLRASAVSLNMDTTISPRKTWPIQVRVREYEKKIGPLSY